MSKKKRMSWSLGFLLIAALPGWAFAQITVTGSSYADPSSLWGVTATMCESGPFTIPVGVTGGPQVWDFSALTGGEAEMTMTFLNPGETPFAHLFPEANVCWYVEGDFLPGGDPYYGYRKVSPSKVEDLGMKGASLDIVYSAPVLTWEWPLSFGTIRTATSTSTEWGTETHEIEADAWGTVKVPTGTFECLRVRRHTTRISGDETVRERFIFQWLTEDGTEVAALWSVENWEEDPSFSVTQIVFVQKSGGWVAVPGSSWGTIKGLFR